MDAFVDVEAEGDGGTCRFWICDLRSDVIVNSPLKWKPSM